MNKDAKEAVQLLRIPLVALALTLLFCAAIVLVSRQYHQHSQRELATANNRLNEARAKADRVGIEEKEIREFHPRYLAIKASGLLDKTTPDDWQDTLREISGQNRLSGLSYEISPREPFTVNTPHPANLQPASTRIKLTADLFHETELLNLLKTLQDRKLGNFVLQSCLLRPKEEKPLVIGENPQLLGECVLDWVSLGGEDAK